MLVPTKHERLNDNTLVIGAIIIDLLKRPLGIQVLFEKIKEQRQMDLNTFFDALTYLWLARVVTVKGFDVYLNKK